MPTLPLPLESNYEHKRFQVRTLNMRRDVQGYQTFPGAAEFADLGVPTYANYLDLPQGTTISWVDFKFGDGDSQVYAMRANGRIYSYPLSTDKDLSTAGSQVEYDARTEITDANALAFNDDGTTLIVADGTDVKAFTLSTGWDITTASRTAANDYDASGDITGEIVDLFITSTNPALWLLGSDGTVHSFNISSSNPSTASSGASLDISSDMTAPKKFAVFSQPGTVRFTVSGTFNSGFSFGIFGYSGSSTVSSATLKSLTNQSLFWDGTGLPRLGNTLSFSSDGSTVALFGEREQNGDDFFQTYTLPRPEYIAAGSYAASFLMGGLLYVIFGPNLYRISSSGVITEMGPFPIARNLHGSLSHLVTDTDGTQVVMCQEISSTDTVARYTSASGLEEVTDADLEQAGSCAHLDNRFYYSQPDGQIRSSAFSDATDITASDVITAESFTDDLKRVISDNRLLYACGVETTEAYKMIDEGNTGLSRQRALDNIGIIGTDAATKNDTGIYILDQKRRLILIQGLSAIPILNHGFADAVAGYTTVSDCLLTSFSYEHETFIQITFPTENKTWVYHEQTGEFIERETSASEYLITGYQEVYGKLIGIGETSGKIYELNESTFQDDSTSITKTKDVYFSCAKWERVPSTFTVNGLMLQADSSGSADIDVQVSTDLSTFTSKGTITVNGPGVYTEQGLGEFPGEGLLRLTTSADVRLNLIGASMNVEFHTL